jgi:phage tail-like protein
MSDQPTVSGAHHFSIDLGGAEGDMLFISASAIGGTLDLPSLKTIDGQHSPVNSIGGGKAKVNWTDLTLSRGIDDKHSLYDWFQDIRDNGVTADTKKDIKIIGYDASDSPLFTWNITGAVITTFTGAAVDAQTSAILTETVSLTFEDAKLEFG